MNYPAQSDIWRLEMVSRAKPAVVSNGRSRLLGRYKQLFFLSIFQDELIVEELRIVWVRKLGPWASEVISTMATDIACVNASSGLFFGHIHIKSLTGGPDILVEGLLRSDVYKIRSLVEGIALAAREGLSIENGNIELERQNLLKAGDIA